MDSSLLTLIAFLPAAAGLALALVKNEGVVRKAALGVSLVVFALAAWLWFGLKPVEGMQFAFAADWVPAFGIRYAVGVDGIAAAMVVLTALLMPLAIQASSHQPRGFLIALLFLETGMVGAFIATDLFLFYVFWEAMLSPMYLIIGICGGPRRV